MYSRLTINLMLLITLHQSGSEENKNSKIEEKSLGVEEERKGLFSNYIPSLCMSER